MRDARNGIKFKFTPADPRCGVNYPAASDNAGGQIQQDARTRFGGPFALGNLAWRRSPVRRAPESMSRVLINGSTAALSALMRSQLN